MTIRLPVDSAPGSLEPFAQHFDPLFPKRSQRQAFRDYLAALLLPTERNKALTALAHTEPIVGAQAAPAQRLQWFLSESTWDADAGNTCRLAALSALPALNRSSTVTTWLPLSQKAASMAGLTRLTLSTIVKTRMARLSIRKSMLQRSFGRIAEGGVTRALLFTGHPSRRSRTWIRR